MDGFSARGHKVPVAHFGSAFSGRSGGFFAAGRSCAPVGSRQPTGPAGFSNLSPLGGPTGPRNAGDIASLAALGNRGRPHDAVRSGGSGGSGSSGSSGGSGTGTGTGTGAGVGSDCGPGGAGSDAPLARGRGWDRRFGAYGEAEAARYLEREGYRILERNWTCNDPDLRGELDLIAGRRRTIVAVEVKTRSTNHLAHPAEAVTRAKAIRLRRLAVRWLSGRRTRPGGQRLLRQTNELRIDIIAIRTEPTPPFAVLELEHLVGVA